MSIGSARQRRPSQSSNIPQQDKRRRWFLRRGNVGSRGRHGTSTYETQRAVKAARKFQSPVERPRALSHESDIEAEHDINDPFQDSDFVVDEPANEYLTNPSESDEEDVLEYKEPLQSLLDRLERLSSSVVRLDKMQRFPFLRRNLRRGFQLRCRTVGVDTNPQPLPRTSISVVYDCLLADGASSRSGGFRTTTAKSSMKNWLCPLCDLHKKFDNPRVLDKHLAWDHSSVKVLWDQVRLACQFRASTLWNVQHHATLSLTIPDSLPES